MRASNLILACAAAAALGACGSRIDAPDDVVDAWVTAIEDGRCAAAARLLEPSAMGGLDADAWASWCEVHLTSLQTQSARIAAARRDGALTVTARLPLDIARDVELVHDGARWTLADHPPLPGGGDDPVDALASLAAALSSDGMRDVLAVLSGDARERYSAEIDAVVDALLTGRSAQVRVTGESATVEVDTIRVRLVHEDGAWRVDEIEQSGIGLGRAFYE